MTDNLQLIAPDKRVTLHFSVLLLDGTIIDSTRDRQPATFQFGDGNLLPGFERLLVGLKVGDRRSIIVEAAQGFGLRTDANLQTVPRDRFAAEIRLEPGLVVSFANAGDGGELPGVVQQVSDEEVLVDFNHPLAGRDLTFEVEIIDIQPTAQPVSIKGGISEN